MNFKLNEIIFLVAGSAESDKKYDGVMARVVGLYGDQAAIGGGTKKGYSIRVCSSNELLICKERHLRRGKLERGNMDDKITWSECSYIPRHLRKINTDWYRRIDDN